MRHRPMTKLSLNPRKLMSALIGCLNRLVVRIVIPICSILAMLLVLEVDSSVSLWRAAAFGGLLVLHEKLNNK